MTGGADGLIKIFKKGVILGGKAKAI